MFRLLGRRLRPRTYRSTRFASSTNEQTVGELLKWEMDTSKGESMDVAGSLPEEVPNVAATSPDAFSLSMVDTTDLSFLQNTFFDLYSVVSDSLGVSPFIAMPLTVLTGRLLLWPMYVRLRRKMPIFMLLNTKMQITQKRHIYKIQTGYYETVEDLEAATVKNTDEVKALSLDVMRNYPIIEVLPVGLFLSSNLYASWSICNAVGTAVPFLWIENICLFDPVVAACASSVQLLAIYLGAETGLETKGEEKDDLQARIQKKVQTFFMGMIMLTLPMQYYFSCPAFISACWVGNTLVTLAFSKMVRLNAEKLNIPNVKVEMDEMRSELLTIGVKMVEADAFVKMQENKIENIENMQVKVTKMQNMNRFEQMKKDQQKMLAELKKEKQKKENES